MPGGEIWLRYKGTGKKRRPDSWYHRRLRLCTKDAIEARARARLAVDGKWPPPDESAADVTAAAFAISREPPPAAPPPAPAPPPPDPPPAAPLTGDWTHASTAAAAETSPPADLPAPEPEISSEQLAELIVTLELKAAEIYTRTQVFDGFNAPPMPDEGRAVLVGAYRSILDYGGAALALPPWLDRLIKGVVIPGVTVVVSSMAIVGGYRDLALEQKRAAEGPGGA